MSALRLDTVSFSYPATAPVVDSCSLAVEPGEMLALLGASGCGKTTILRLIAGLLQPAGGRILFDGEPIGHLPTQQRRTAMVFQKPLLFPHLSVAENVAFGLTVRRTSEAVKRERVAQALAMVKLEGLESRRPSQLSGGQEQRVSIARALVSEPRVLLLDEPFTALDENLRGEIRALVRRIQRQLRLTAVFVTHDRHEAAAVAHRIAFLHQGRILQTGALRDFYTQPATLEAARFFGLQMIAGEVSEGGAVLHTALGVHQLPEATATRSVWVCFRPESARLESADTSDVIVDASVDLGDRASTQVRLPGGESIEIHHPLPAREAGDRVAVHVSADALRVFKRDGASVRS